ncbi:MAG: capsule biosynthesis protein CapA, partial [Pseudomonadota bacterium]
LAHDASFRDHSDFSHISEFIDICCKGFARGAPKHHRLVFKTHPLEDGREHLRELIRRAAQTHGISDRVQMIRGGKLGEMLDRATTAVTVNSTAGQQVLWRGLPLKAFGRSVYSKPEFVSHQPIHEFFAHPRRPDHDAYMVFRQFLLETSQFPGGFYTAEGRADVIRGVADIVLENRDPYDRAHNRGATSLPQLSAR